MALLVIPGSAAFSSITSLTSSSALTLSPLPSCGDGPSPQWRATVCLSRPYRLPMSGRLGFTPVCLHMLGSPITFLSTCAPPLRDWPSRKGHTALVPLAHPRWCVRWSALV